MVSDSLLKCISLLKEKKLTIAFAEGASGGKICYNFSAVSTSEKIILGKIVALKDHMKEYFFGINSEILQQFGSESAEVARQMAHGLCDYLDADIRVSVTGDFNEIVPNDKQQQSIFIHIIFPDNDFSEKLELTGNSADMAEQVVTAISEIIVEHFNIEV